MPGRSTPKRGSASFAAAQRTSRPSSRHSCRPAKPAAAGVSSARISHPALVEGDADEPLLNRVDRADGNVLSHEGAGVCGRDEAASYVTGATIAVDGGYTAI
ncbi:hypothetical protein GCM10011611_16230 [Aliidongia dinghuensis]|uniref:Uncharacterized protein n=1 Tax=Aliidongia dinghuensis TaxID=1867774 RepID=A0A8J2YRT7_9PROT|nr:hypothetical protein GCM10011611_16230 [Aliidongia dinghuensis]